MLASIYPNDFLYELIKFLHILAVIVGFGSTFVWPMLASKARATGDPKVMLEATRISVDSAKILTSPFIYAVGVTGLIMMGIGQMADFKYNDGAWIIIAFVLYLVALGIAIGLHTPNIKAMLGLQEEMMSGPPPAGGPPPQLAELQARGKKAGMFGGILHLLFAVILILMVFQPGA
jgi:uncharacterized membrane protein